MTRFALLLLVSALGFGCSLSLDIDPGPSVQDQWGNSPSGYVIGTTVNLRVDRDDGAIYALESSNPAVFDLRLEESGYTADALAEGTSDLILLRNGREDLRREVRVAAVQEVEFSVDFEQAFVAEQIVDGPAAMMVGGVLPIHVRYYADSRRLFTSQRLELGTGSPASIPASSRHGNLFEIRVDELGSYSIPLSLAGGPDLPSFDFEGVDAISSIEFISALDRTPLVADELPTLITLRTFDASEREVLGIRGIEWRLDGVSLGTSEIVAISAGPVGSSITLEAEVPGAIATLVIEGAEDAAILE